jgi:hypothetical protein
MKNLMLAILCLISLSMHGQEVNAEFDGHKWKAPYNLSTPAGWGVERFLIPISFAPQIPYKGVEDIRFTPGWAKLKTDEYWTYAFLWYLDSKPETNAKIIAENLKAYYTGLIKSNTDSAKAATGRSVPVTTVFEKTTTANGDLETYTGTIEMTDYMQQKPITLNCMVHLKFCAEENKTIVFYELSPKPFAHGNWINLNQLWLGFRCKKD